MRTSLFLDAQNHAAAFTKTAGMQAPLPSDTSMWERAILDEAYKQLPFLEDYDVQVSMRRQDDDQGYGFGGIILRPRSNLTENESVEENVPMAMVPVVVRDWKMAPLDIFGFRGHYQPLTRARLSRALFRPNVFDAPREAPPTRSMFRDVQPPSEALYGHASKVGSFTVPDPSEKLGSYLVPILPRLQGRVRTEHVDRIKEALHTPEVRAAIMARDPIKAAYSSALQLTPFDAKDGAEKVGHALKMTPSVMQVRRQGARFFVKHANAAAFAPQEEEMSAAEAEPMMAQAEEMNGQMVAAGEDEDAVERVDDDTGAVTVAPEAAVKTTLDSEEIGTVDRFGTWVVQDTSGRSLIGFCFPQALSLDMQPLPLTIFTNGSQFAIQETVAGKLQAVSTQIPKANPGGFGAFYYLDHGSARAFEPMTIKGSFQGPEGGLCYQVHRHITGEEAVLCLYPGLKACAAMGPGMYAVPEDLCWLSLAGGNVQLVEEPGFFMKVAEHSIGYLQGNADGEFQVKGTPFQFMDKEACVDLSRDEAVFLLAAAGVHPSVAKTASVRAQREKVAFGGLRPVVSAKVAMDNARVKAASMTAHLAEVGIKNYDLTKEAAMLEDALTADKVLSLGLINAENVGTFVELIPSFEATLRQVCSMLLSTRAGLSHVPETALERVVAGLDSTIQGLHRLQMAEQYKED